MEDCSSTIKTYCKLFTGSAAYSDFAGCSGCSGSAACFGFGCSDSGFAYSDFAGCSDFCYSDSGNSFSSLPEFRRLSKIFVMSRLEFGGTPKIRCLIILHKSSAGIHSRNQ